MVSSAVRAVAFRLLLQVISCKYRVRQILQ